MDEVTPFPGRLRQVHAPVHPGQPQAGGRHTLGHSCQISMQDAVEGARRFNVFLTHGHCPVAQRERVGRPRCFWQDCRQGRKQVESGISDDGLRNCSATLYSHSKMARAQQCSRLRSFRQCVNRFSRLLARVVVAIVIKAAQQCHVAGRVRKVVFQRLASVQKSRGDSSGPNLHIISRLELAFFVIYNCRLIDYADLWSDGLAG